MNTPKKHILVVDDDPKITRLVRLDLELSGEYEVREETHARHALAAAQEFLPDLILMDVMMPGVDGGKLASQFREIPRFRVVPIVFLTATVTAEEVSAQGGCIGGERFLAKPVDAAELISCLHEQLEAGPGHPLKSQAGDDTDPHFAF